MGGCDFQYIHDYELLLTTYRYTHYIFYSKELQLTVMEDAWFAEQWPSDHSSTDLPQAAQLALCLSTFSSFLSNVLMCLVYFVSVCIYACINVLIYYLTRCTLLGNI